MADPLIYIFYKYSTTEFCKQLINIRTHREIIILYSTSRRVLENEKYRLIITAKEYYNQVRKQVADKNKLKIIEEIIVALQETDFVYRTKVNIEKNGFRTIISKSFV
jgi:mannose-1-phosphate guanylyltransferase